ncbi:hypothetical protein LTR08_003162 [Meristemomyces frigidus]|nr:hypothetical protein LTR08_003162 [Meristemomyces frigidus]
MQNIREKLKRKLSMKDQHTNLDDDYEADDVDEETTGHLHREIEKAEQANEPYGRSGSFLNRLITHGNKKTEEQIAKEHNQIREQALSKENQKPQTST